MNGHRSKALKRAFTLKYGRPPKRTRAARTNTGAIEAFPPTTIKNFKERRAAWAKWLIAAYTTTDKHAIVKAKYDMFAERFLRHLLTIKVTEPSEWRRWKKSYQPSAIRSQPRGVLSAMSVTAREENNARSLDKRDKSNQATGKMRRAGVYATKIRSGIKEPI